MKRAAKEVFSSLGELRDTQVMKQWIEELAPESDIAGKILGDFVVEREQELKKTAAETLLHFDCKQWKTWATELPSRAARIPAEGPVLAQLALERWQEAVDALRRTVALNAEYTSAYQMLGTALMKLGRREDARLAWIEGIEVAGRTGAWNARQHMERLLAGSEDVAGEGSGLCAE